VPLFQIQNNTTELLNNTNAFLPQCDKKIKGYVPVSEHLWAAAMIFAQIGAAASGLSGPRGPYPMEIKG
jgi:hypothetical protein